MVAPRIKRAALVTHDGAVHDYLVANQKQFGSISTSQHAEHYFQRYGAARIGFEEHGWGEGMHRVEMLLPVANKL